MLRLDEFFLVKFFYFFFIIFFIPKQLIYVRIYSFLKKLIHSLQFGFRQNCSTTHTLIHLKNRIKKETDKCIYAFEVFVDFEKKTNSGWTKCVEFFSNFKAISIVSQVLKQDATIFFFFLDPSSCKLTYIKENIL